MKKNMPPPHFKYNYENGDVSERDQVSVPSVIASYKVTCMQMAAAADRRLAAIQSITNNNREHAVA